MRTKIKSSHFVAAPNAPRPAFTRGSILKLRYSTGVFSEGHPCVVLGVRKRHSCLSGFSICVKPVGSDNVRRFDANWFCEYLDQVPADLRQDLKAPRLFASTK